MYKLVESKKLFYKKFYFKLTCKINNVRHFFRHPNGTSKRFMDQLEQKFQSSKVEKVKLPGYYYPNNSATISKKEFIENKILLQDLDNTDNEFKLRCDYPNKLSIYSNNYNWLEEIANKLSMAKELHSPNEKMISSLQSNTIIVGDKFNYDYKITFNKNNVDSSFVDFCKNNKKYIRISRQTLYWIKKYGFASGLYFYVKGKNTLLMANMIAGNSFGRIYQLLRKGDIDK